MVDGLHHDETCTSCLGTGEELPSSTSDTDNDAVCEMCGGSGELRGDDPCTCFHCGGSGRQALPFEGGIAGPGLSTKPAADNSLTTVCGICDGAKTIYTLDQTVSCPGCCGSGQVVPAAWVEDAPVLTPGEWDTATFTHDLGEYTVSGKPQDIERLKAHVAALTDMLAVHSEAIQTISELGRQQVIDREQLKFLRDHRDKFAEDWARLAEQLGIPYPNPNLFELVSDRVANLTQQRDFLAAHHIRADHPLQSVFSRAIRQCAEGKGEERHGAGRPFFDQPWKHIADAHGRGYLTGQASKKLEESSRLATQEAWIKELLGVINYAAMAILYREHFQQHAKEQHHAAA